MNAVFVDTLYWVAIVRPNDSWQDAAKRARSSLGEIQLVTTDEVLTEFLSALAKGSPAIRQVAVQMVRAILANPQVQVVPQSREGFLEAIALFDNRPDKQYSLVDCRSMQVMKAQSIQAVLTNDLHFKQEGFQVLIQ